jgi:hypothetical protein
LLLIKLFEEEEEEEKPRILKLNLKTFLGKRGKNHLEKLQKFLKENFFVSVIEKMKIVHLFLSKK